jgi:hypothetical protein
MDCGTFQSRTLHVFQAIRDKSDVVTAGKRLQHCFCLRHQVAGAAQIFQIAQAEIFRIERGVDFVEQQVEAFETQILRGGFAALELAPRLPVEHLIKSPDLGVVFLPNVLEGGAQRFPFGFVVIEERVICIEK